MNVYPLTPILHVPMHKVTQTNNPSQAMRYIVARHRHSISKALRVIIHDQFEGSMLVQEELHKITTTLGSLVGEIFTAIAKLLP